MTSAFRFPQFRIAIRRTVINNDERVIRSGVIQQRDQHNYDGKMEIQFRTNRHNYKIVKSTDV